MIFATIATLSAIHIGWTLGLSHETWLLLWLLSGGTGRFLDLIFTISLTRCPSKLRETTYAKRTPRICLTRSAAPAH